MRVYCVPSRRGLTVGLTVGLAALALCCQPSDAVRSLTIASPLQALTLWDAPLETPRSRFLPRFRKALTAERTARAASVQADADQVLAASVVPTSPNWAARAAAADVAQGTRADRKASAAFDAAFRQADDDDAVADTPPPKSARYQLVGVVQPPTHSVTDHQAICWYARPKADDATWSVRLVHVNRQAVVYDLVRRGRVDVLGKYRNRGFVQTTPDESATSASETAVVPSSVPLVEAEYTVRERSWKTLWNFSPTHMFSDSGGMYWRERRLRPGLYTDGASVYESSYRYTDGRNGMHRKSTLPQFLQSAAVPDNQKTRILQRLEHETPDLVLEE